MPSNSSGPGLLLSSVSCGRIDALTRQPRVRTWHYGPSAQAHPRVRQLFVAIASQPFADGEPQRPASGLPGEPSHGDGGAGCGPRAAGRGTRTRVPSQDSWCGHGPQHEGLCGSDASPRRYPAHCAEHARSSAIAGCTTRHCGYALSQWLRKRVEEVFGWMKTEGGFRRTRYRGLDCTALPAPSWGQPTT